MTRIVHVSDTHGYLSPLPPDAQVVVHSGDFLPNKTFGVWSIERAFQPTWIEQNAEQIKRWVRDRPFLITHGNHDYIDSVPFLRAIGVDAHCLDDVRYVHDGIVFHGFPHVPFYTGQWNYETSNRELEARTQAIDLEGVNVLVSHSPFYGVLDMNRKGIRCGSKPMRHRMQHSSHVPEYFLCGHIHESNGRQAWSRGIQVYNSATVQHMIDIE